MALDGSTPLATFLDGLAAKQPTPGGGSATALVGAISAATAEMVLNYSVNKKSLESFRPELEGALARFHKARQMLTQLVVEDQLAYEQMSAMRKMPGDDVARGEAWNAAVIAAVRVPEAIAASSVAVLELCDDIVDKVNPMLLSDLAVSADLAMASIRCAIYNVRANLPEVEDPQVRLEAERTITDLLIRAGEVIQRITPRIREQMAMRA